MRRCLALISLLLVLCVVPYAAQAKGNASSLVSDTTVCEEEYNMLMQVRGNEITGICVMNVGGDNSIVGTIVNEFGVKAFDFISSNGKTKVLNVMGPLDKWYIRMVLRKDFAFFLANRKGGKDVRKGKRVIKFMPNGDIEVFNKRIKIHYTFTPMRSNP